MHNIKQIVQVIVAVLLAASLAAQDHSSRFKELVEKKDTAAQLKLLQEWDAGDPKDPELYVAWFNFYVQQSVKDIISLEKTPQKEALKLSDSTGKPAGYLNFSTQYISDILQKGFEYIDKGITLHPARLDMRFGKIYMLGKAENFEMFTKTIIGTIEYSNTINHAWLWKEGKPLEDAKSFLIESMQDYIATIYNTEDDSLLPYMRQISETVLKYEPEHVISLANIALTYAIEENYDKALLYLLKAEKIEPKDVIVLNNIAEIYARKKDKVNARTYYGKIIKVGSKEEADDARQKIKELN